MVKTQNHGFEKRASIVALLKAVLANHNTTTQLQYRPTTVVKTIARDQERGNFKDKPQSGAPRIPTACDDRCIAQAIRIHRIRRAPSLIFR